MSESSAPARWQQSGLIWLALFPPLIALDLWTKQLAITHLNYAQPVPVLPGLNWTLVHNHGAAFSFLSDAGGWQRWLFTALAIGISLLLLTWLRKEPRSDWRQCLPFALIISGAIGNLIDRIRFGYVIDFIDVYWRQSHWPAFNIADSCISVGAVLLVFFAFRKPSRRPNESNA
jgi:signal peptidase II